MSDTHYGFVVPDISNFHTANVTSLCGKGGHYYSELNHLVSSQDGNVNCQECLSIGKFLNESGTGHLIWEHLGDVMELVRLIIHGEASKMSNSIRQRLTTSITKGLELPSDFPGIQDTVEQDQT